MYSQGRLHRHNCHYITHTGVSEAMFRKGNIRQLTVSGWVPLMRSIVSENWGYLKGCKINIFWSRTITGRGMETLYSPSTRMQSKDANLVKGTQNNSDPSSSWMLNIYWPLLGKQKSQIAFPKTQKAHWPLKKPLEFQNRSNPWKTTIFIGWPQPSPSLIPT